MVDQKLSMNLKWRNALALIVDDPRFQSKVESKILDRRSQRAFFESYQKSEAAKEKKLVAAFVDELEVCSGSVVVGLPRHAQAFCRMPNANSRMWGCGGCGVRGDGAVTCFRWVRVLLLCDSVCCGLPPLHPHFGRV